MIFLLSSHYPSTSLPSADAKMDNKYPNPTTLPNRCTSHHQDEDDNTLSQLHVYGFNDESMDHSHHPNLRTVRLPLSAEDQNARFVEASSTSTSLVFAQHIHNPNVNFTSNPSLVDCIDAAPIQIAKGQDKRSKTLLVLSLVGEYCRSARDTAAASKFHDRDFIKKVGTGIPLWLKRVEAIKAEKAMIETSLAEWETNEEWWAVERKELERSQARLDEDRARLTWLKKDILKLPEEDLTKLPPELNLNLNYHDSVEDEMDLVNRQEDVEEFETLLNAKADTLKVLSDLIGQGESDHFSLGVRLRGWWESVHQKLTFCEIQRDSLQTKVPLFTERMEKMEQEEEEWEATRIAVEAVGRIETM